MLNAGQANSVVDLVFCSLDTLSFLTDSSSRLDRGFNIMFSAENNPRLHVAPETELFTARYLKHSRFSQKGKLK